MAKKASGKGAASLPCEGTDSVLDAFSEWITRVSAKGTHSPAKIKHIAALYAEDAVFFGTVSPWLRETRAGVEKYFEHFLDKKDEIQIIVADRPRIRVLPDESDPQMAVNTGYYIFFYEKDGVLHSVPARYSFVYRCDAGEWMIIDHHSSAMPQ